MRICVKVGTKNKVKISAVQAAFEMYFDEVRVLGYDVDSQVPEQPIDDDVYEGAENRLKGLKEKGEMFDFVVACEAGLIQQYGRYFNVQIVLVEDKAGKRGFGMSQGFEIPRQYADEAISNNVAVVLDRIFDGKGGIRVLTKGQFNRGKMVRDGTIMALTRVLNGESW